MRAMEDADGRDLVRRYLDEIGSVPLLTAAQEVELAKRIEAGLYAAELLRQANADQESPGGRSRAELAAVAEDGRSAKDRMIRANLRLVVSVVKRHPRRVLPLLDAIQEGNLGLIHAVEKFDYAKGYKFSTYATWWIRQALARGSAQQSRTVRLPIHVMEELNKLDQIERGLGVQLGHDPSTEELAKASDIPEPRIAELRRAARDTLSLDTPIDEDGQLRLVDVITETDPPEIGENMERRSLVADVRAVVATLPTNEALVIRQRYGLGGQARTLREIGDELGVSRERVRQLELHGLIALREDARRRVLLPWTG